MLAFSMLAVGQLAVVEYMKVAPGNGGKYVAVEKEWKKNHEARLKGGLIESWTLYENMFAGADEPYQFATVTIYKDFATYEKEGFDSVAREAYPKFKDKDWDEFYEKTEKSRVLSSMEAFYGVMFDNAKSTNPACT